MKYHTLTEGANVILLEEPAKDLNVNWSDYETMMKEKSGKDLTPHRVKYRTLKR